MIEPLFIAKTEATPKVELNNLTNRFLISGESRPENVTHFYAPVFNWFHDYFKSIKNSASQINLEIHFDYFNSTTGKTMYELISKIKTETLSKGNSFKVTWKHNKFDEDLLETGKELSLLLNVDFEFVALS